MKAVVLIFAVLVMSGYVVQDEIVRLSMDKDVRVDVNASNVSVRCHGGDEGCDVVLKWPELGNLIGIAGLEEMKKNEAFEDEAYGLRESLLKLADANDGQMAGSLHIRKVDLYEYGALRHCTGAVLILEAESPYDFEWAHCTPGERLSSYDWHKMCRDADQHPTVE